MQSVCAGWLAVRRFAETDDSAQRRARSHDRPDLDDDCSRAMLLRRSDRDSSRFGGGNTTDSGRFRSRGSDGEGTLADLVHQTAMYYEDRLSGAGFSRVMLCGASASGDAHAPESVPLRHSLEERLGTTVNPVDPRAAAALTDRIDGAPALLDALAPLVGMLVRDGVAP